MSQATDYLEGKLLDHICGLATYSPLANLYLGYMTAIADGETASLTEVSSGAYGRATIVNDGTSWSRTGQIVKNINIIPFAAASAPQGTVTHWGLWDASSAGNLLIYGTLPASQAIGTGATPRVAAEKLQITFAFRSNYLAGEMLDHFFGIDAGYTPPTDVDIALYTAAPTDAGGGTEVSSSGTDYAREEIPNDASSWTRTANVVENDNDIDWLEAAAAYGIVTAQAAFEAGTSNMMWWKNLEVSQNIGIGSQFGFTPGQYRIQLN